MESTHTSQVRARLHSHTHTSSRQGYSDVVFRQIGCRRRTAAARSPLSTMAPRELHVLLLLCGCCSLLLAQENSTSTSAPISQNTKENGTKMTTEDNAVQQPGNASSAAPSVATPSTSGSPLNSTTATSNTTAFSKMPASNDTITNGTSNTPESNSTENTTQAIPLPVTPNRSETNTSTDITEKPTISTVWTTVNSTGVPQEESGTQRNPGLIAVLCIFLSILAIVVVVVVVKFCQNREPSFKKLDEVPMSGVSEEAPFARYPPK